MNYKGEVSQVAANHRQIDSVRPAMADIENIENGHVQVHPMAVQQVHQHSERAMRTQKGYSMEASSRNSQCSRLSSIREGPTGFPQNRDGFKKNIHSEEIECPSMGEGIDSESEDEYALMKKAKQKITSERGGSGQSKGTL